MNITNVTVKDARGTWDSTTNIVLSWYSGEGLYHVWENDPGVLFKNSIPGYGEPGYFRTRKLDPASKSNAKMIDEARAIALAENLYEKAQADRKEKQDLRDAEAAKARALHAKKEAGPELYEALKMLLKDYIADAPGGFRASVALAREAIAKVEDK